MYHIEMEVLNENENEKGNYTGVKLGSAACRLKISAIMVSHPVETI